MITGFKKNLPAALAGLVVESGRPLHARKNNNTDSSSTKNSNNSKPSWDAFMPSADTQWLVQISTFAKKWQRPALHGDGVTA